MLFSVLAMVAVKKVYLTIKSNKKSNIILYKSNPQNKHNTQKQKMLRYIGVTYNDNTELESHYSYTNIDCEFDYVVYFEKSTAVDELQINL